MNIWQGWQVWVRLVPGYAKVEIFKHAIILMCLCCQYNTAEAVFRQSQAIFYCKPLYVINKIIQPFVGLSRCILIMTNVAIRNLACITIIIQI